MNYDLFDQNPSSKHWTETIDTDVVVLRHYAVPHADELIDAIRSVEAQAPFRHMQTAGGFTMSAALTCCGDLGWISDRKGYRYAPQDPLSQQPWPDMPGATATVRHTRGG